MVRPTDTQILYTPPYVDTQARQQPRQQAQPQTRFTTSELNYIPSPESLQTLTANALQAVKRGQAVERGSILNILV